MRWERSGISFSRFYFCAVLLLAAVILSPLGAQETIQISPQQFNELKTLSSELQQQIGPLRTHNAELQRSLNERESLLRKQSEELTPLRHSISDLRTSLEATAKQLEESQKAQTILSQSVIDLADSSRTLKQIAEREGRRRRLWQTLALGLGGATAGAVLSDSPWAPVIGFAGVVGITVGVRSIGP